METSEKPGYPTDQQIDEVFAAWKCDGKQGILELLKKRKEERDQSCKRSTDAAPKLQKAERSPAPK